MTSYSLSREARQDIDEILVYIAADQLDAAVSFNDRLDETFTMLADNPKAGRERPELNQGVRSFPVGNYLIFYQVWARKVTIARAIHGARDLDEMFS